MNEESSRAVPAPASAPAPAAAACKSGSRSCGRFLPAAACVAAVVLLVCLFASPCGRRTRWYPVEGGYVNLDQVATVRATGKLVLKVTETTEKKDLLGRTKTESETRVAAVLLDGPVTEESVAAAKAKLARAPKGAFAEGGAGLHLDRVSVPFAPVPAKADAAALSALLDGWLAQARSIDAYVK